MRLSLAVLTFCLLTPALPETTTAQKKTNAYQAREIHCQVNNRPKSRFVDQGNRTWVEHTASGKQWRFRERNRDEWSVYLQDSGRKLQVQLKLHTKKVSMSQNGRRSVICSVTKVFAKGQRPQRPAKPNLNNPAPGPAKLKAPVTQMVRCQLDGRFARRFSRQGNSRIWNEQTANNQRYQWTERSRDEWSIYLTDTRQRGRDLQLDLYQKKVKLSDRGRRQVLCIIDDISQGSVVAQRPGPPSSSPSPPPPPNVPPPGQTAAPPSGAPFVEEVKDVKIPGVSETTTRRLVQWVIKESGRLEQPVCWKDSRPNTAGKPLTQCPPDKEKDGALCYPKCKKGYHGVGPVCWQDCPSRFKDTGGHCLKPKSYGRGAGYPWKLGDKLGSLTAARKRCKKKHKKCEKHGAIIYPKCKKGFKPAGCCVCSPKCPSGMTDIGVSCQKKSYGRTAGEPLQCRANQVQKGALCYPKCPSGYAHGGPVCWRSCEPGHPVDCGAMCGQSSAQCVGEVSNMVLSSGVVVANVAGAALTGGAANAGMSAAKTAARAGSKIVAKNALKRVVAKAGATISKKLQRRLGARVINYAARKSGRKAGSRLARDYMKMVTYRAGKKIALAQASTDLELREIAAMVDPTGVVDVINAFDKPICKPTPMP